MAITLSVALTDAEQAKVIEWLDVIKPGLSAAQKKKALEDHAKLLLRNDLTRRVKNSRRQTVLDAEAAANQVDDSVIVVVDPFGPVATP